LFALSAGDDIERAHKLAAQVCGQLGWTIEKRRGNRQILEKSLSRLEEAAAIIRSLLTVDSSGAKVKVSTEEINHGTKDQSR
jgi:hypothetical protein